jgi:hypothetical protein
MKNLKNVGLIPRSGTVNLFGRLKNLVFHEPNIDHLLFYRFLLLSKSYEIAHQVRTKKIKKSDANLIDIDDVLKTYDLVGNIYETPFQVWWITTGQNIFYDAKPVTKMTLTIDLSKGESYVLERVKKAISDTYAMNQKKPSKGITFEVNKIRPVSLFHKFELVRVKANNVKRKAIHTSNWRMAVQVGFGSKYIQQAVSGFSQVEDGNKIREYLGDFVARKLTEAKLIAENAARRKFPSNKSLNTALDFDFQKLDELIRASDNSELLLLKFQPRDKWPLNYFDQLALISNVDFFKSNADLVL